MPPPTRMQEWLKDQLAELEDILENMGADFSGLATTAGELRHRFNEGCFRLAVVGQFKRGKSTLLNALLHEPLLPMGILPLTTIPTTLRYGPERHVRISFRDGRCEDHYGSLEVLQRTLTRYVTEEDNPGNKLEVARVEVDHPGTLLAKSVEIIDTPGIGSTILSNTRMARDTLPVCDGAIFVLSPDPPITEVEVQFLRAVHDATTRVIFVLTKSDMLLSEDRELLTFLKKVLHDEAGFSNQERIFLVSARQALEAYPQEDERAQVQSGVPELESFLADFLLTDKHAALHEAIKRKGAHLVREVLFLLDLQRKVIELPREDLDRRAKRFEAHLAKIDKEQMYFHDRLRGDREHIMEEVDRQGVTLCRQTQEALTAFVQKACEEGRHDTSVGRFEAHIRTALSEEVERMFERSTKELFAMVTDRFKPVQEVHCNDMEVLIHRIRQTAADLFEVPCLEGVMLDRVDFVREPCLVGHRWVTSFTEEAISWMRRFLPRRLRAQWIERRLHDDIGYLVVRNIGELRWTISQNLEEAFRQFETRIEMQLTSVLHSIRTSIQTALKVQQQRESRERPELRRLQGYRQRLEQVWTRLSPQRTSRLEGGPL